MTQELLFVEICHRLKNYADTCLLMWLLHAGMDEAPFACSVEHIASKELGGAVTRAELRRSIERLQSAGLIAVQAHPNTKTEFRAERAAVLALLQTSLPKTSYFPGKSSEPLKFLDAWSASVIPLPQGDPE